VQFGTAGINQFRSRSCVAVMDHAQIRPLIPQSHRGLLTSARLGILWPTLLLPSRGTGKELSSVRVLITRDSTMLPRVLLGQGHTSAALVARDVGLEPVEDRA
jgi:hypothetical protein